MTREKLDPQTTYAYGTPFSECFSLGTKYFIDNKNVSEKEYKNHIKKLEQEVRRACKAHKENKTK